MNKKPSLPSYTETLSDALNAIYTILVSGEKYSFLNDEFASFWANCGGVQYQTAKQITVEVLNIKKPSARRYLTTVIYRMPSGRYELNAYVN